MAKISKSEIYAPDTNLNRDDSWVGTDAQDNKKTKTYYLGSVMDYVAENIGAEGFQDNTFTEKALGVIDNGVDDALIDVINTLASYDVAATEIVIFTGEFSETTIALNTKFVYVLKTGKGTYGLENTQITLDDLLLVNPKQYETSRNTTVINGLVQTDQILEGSSIVWREGTLIFDTRNIRFIIGGTLFEPVNQVLTLGDSDATHGRIDVFAVDSRTGNVVIIEGTPSANPEEPEVEFGYQIRASSVFIPATATEPQVEEGTDFTVNLISDETDTSPLEWDLIATPTNTDVNDTVTVADGVKSINLDPDAVGAIEWQDDAELTYDPDAHLIFKIKLITNFSGSSRIDIRVTNNEGARFLTINSVAKFIEYGYQYNDSGWQEIAIPMSAVVYFINDPDTIFGKLSFTFVNCGRVYLDAIRIQSGAQVNTTTIGEDNVQADWEQTLIDADDYIRNKPTIVSPTGLELITEGGNSGWRLIGQDPADYGDTGEEAVDLSIGGGDLGAHGMSGARGYRSFSAGQSVIASGSQSIAIGTTQYAIGGASIAIGNSGNQSLGLSSTSFGGSANNAVGDYSYAFGNYNYANSLREISIGSFGTNVAGNATTFILTDRLFNLGNGDIISNRSDAFTILKNGLATLPSVTTALIDASGTGKEIVTVEWVNAQGFGAGGGDVTKVGTPVNDQLGVWTGDGTLEGDTNLTFDASVQRLTLGTDDTDFGWIRLYHGNGGQATIDLYADPTASIGYWRITPGFGGSGNFTISADATNVFEIDDATLAAFLPATTIADIDALGAKAIVTKEYLDANSGSNLDAFIKTTGDGTSGTITIGDYDDIADGNKFSLNMATGEFDVGHNVLNATTVKIHENNGLLFYNSVDTFNTQIVNSEAIANWTLTIPLLTADATIATEEWVTANSGATVSDAVYDGTWNGDTEGASKNALYDKIESVIAGVGTNATPQSFTAVGGETTWVVTGAITSSHKFFVNGVKLVEAADYTKTGSTFTFIPTTGYTSVAGHLWEYFPDIAVPTDAGTPEGTAVLSTGETVGKVLQADGDGTSSWVTLSGGGDALVANPLSQFAATTKAQLNGVISDGTPLYVGDVTGVTTEIKPTDIDTLAELNAIVTDATLIDTADARLSDARTPTAHTHVEADITDLQPYLLASDITGKLDNVVEDTTPQLGGELDLNGHSVGGDSQTATGDGTTTIDWKLGNTFDFQFGAFNEVFTFTAPTKAGTFILKLVQDSVGSRTVTFPASVKWSGGTAPTLTTTATTGTDIITFYFDGTNYFAVEALNFS